MIKLSTVFVYGIILHWCCMERLINAYTQAEIFELKYSYFMESKSAPFLGHEHYMRSFPKNSRHYFNSLAVFAFADSTHMHGHVGLYFPNHTQVFVSKPMPKKKLNKSEEKLELKNSGGFSLTVSDALPLDRIIPHYSGKVCTRINYDLNTFEDASVIITVYNEPMSILMRSIHSILNYTPPPLLREIILVDDHSSFDAYEIDGYLDLLVRHLPKTRVIRLPERRGLVHARLVGAQSAKAPIIVVLDSHIEASPRWLEPLLARVRDSPKSLVFPQIPSLDAVRFKHEVYSGIGCKLSFKWTMQEDSVAPSPAESSEPIASASMAGGLFAVRRDTFWDFGGYDEQFSMWGAENVEMPFRYWMCGGRVECAPCSAVYHVYRRGGVGYRSPDNTLTMNRLRTAKAWLGAYFPLTQHVVQDKGENLGSFDKINKLKDRLQCKDFTWFMQNVAKGNTMDRWSMIYILKYIRHPSSNQCIDDLQKANQTEQFGLYPCHYSEGTQAFIYLPKYGQLIPSRMDNKCVTKDLTLDKCSADSLNISIEFDIHQIRVKNNSKKDICLAVQAGAKSVPTNNLTIIPCNQSDTFQHWEMTYQYIEIPPSPITTTEQYSTVHHLRQQT